MMQLKIEEAVKLNDKIFIDVRSSYEFSKGTIPGAINIPLLDDDERIEIGKIYKNSGTIAAKLRGLEFVSVKLPDFYRQILELMESNTQIIVFCARGGLRSTSFVKLLQILEIRGIYQLKGGFKEYRNYVLNFFQDLKEVSFIVLHGLTGVGKTEILEKLHSMGIPILNLEELAHNKGSVFGSIGYSTIANQKNFENEIAEILINNSNTPIVVESESQRLGNVFIPDHLYDKIVNGHHILLETNKTNRTNRLVKDYVNKIAFHDPQLIEAISKLKKRLGKEKVEEYLNLIIEKKYDVLAEDLLDIYYDPLYQYSIEKYNYDITINYDKIEEAIGVISKYYKEKEGKTNK
ncbi:tRNA 2-selenouridine(34) synthase MnmH [Alkaliphilus peptidifermentans]|uniref:tRNA 2-selenouridine synthase n=1 Tax=Alkaliphilus peptidifermentans DSM 18978 TaxID=1120976 RepID=A0A1G5DBT3_9FIRM|nr:tRNA 2-selenouridine(34) synthase MnmH [Alkaliphilus peptidifermentans]SCY12007.1 tRNA 2-selenouridine synthase [Alkaliphilus peptidifermentans DSM 18978]